MHPLHRPPARPGYLAARHRAEAGPAAQRCVRAHDHVAEPLGRVNLHVAQPFDYVDGRFGGARGAVNIVPVRSAPKPTLPLRQLFVDNLEPLSDAG
jgi:hypothetical protein